MIRMRALAFLTVLWYGDWQYETKPINDRYCIHWLEPSIRHLLTKTKKRFFYSSIWIFILKQWSRLNAWIWFFSWSSISDRYFRSNCFPKKFNFDESACLLSSLSIADVFQCVNSYYGQLRLRIQETIFQFAVYWPNERFIFKFIR